jgi:hypothetical protein
MSVKEHCIVPALPLSVATGWLIITTMGGVSEMPEK